MVERFNATLKWLLRKLVSDWKVEWDDCIPYVLWTYRGTTHKTTGFFLYHLLFGKTMRMPLDQLVRFWKGKEEDDSINVSEYVHMLRANMELVRDLAYEKEKREKVKQKSYYDQKTKEHAFEVGSFVLVFRPTMKDKLANQWQDPFPIAKVLTTVTYQIDLGTKNKQYQTFHVNCMKEWKSLSAEVFVAKIDEWEGLGFFLVFLVFFFFFFVGAIHSWKYFFVVNDH